MFSTRVSFSCTSQLDVSGYIPGTEVIVVVEPEGFIVTVGKMLIHTLISHSDSPQLCPGNSSLVQFRRA